jgi:hypothetical protein
VALLGSGREANRGSRRTGGYADLPFDRPNHRQRPKQNDQDTAEERGLLGALKICADAADIAVAEQAENEVKGKGNFEIVMLHCGFLSGEFWGVAGLLSFSVTIPRRMGSATEDSFGVRSECSRKLATMGRE